MDVSHLIFAGFNRRVAAIHRDTGTIAWQWKAPKGSSFVSLLLDGRLLVVSVDGYLYGLEAATGRELWFNPMSGFGTGVTALVSARGTASQSQLTAAAASIATQQQQSAGANTAS